MKDVGENIEDMPLIATLRPVGSTFDWQGLDRILSQAVLVGGDVLSYSVVVAGVLFFGGDSVALLPVFLAAAICTLVAYAALALYPGYRLHSHERLRRRTLASISVAGIAALGVAGMLADWRMGALLLALLAGALALQIAFATLARRALWRAGLWGEDVAVIGGTGMDAYFVKHWHYGIRPVHGFTGTEFRAGAALDRTSTAGRTRVRTALLAAETMPQADQLAALGPQFEEIILLADLPDRRVSGLQPWQVGGGIGLTLKRRGPGPATRLMQRAFDLAVAVPCALFALPIVGMAALAVWIADPGPVFFRHRREGLAGKPIRLLKLRTMYQNAEQRLSEMLETDPAAREEWETHFKLKEDPRILPVVGTFLRASSCDELPQLYHIFTGEMRIVGPRPFPDYHMAAMDSDFRLKRQTVTPGITGLWQVSERSDADVKLQMQLDGFYIDNQSLWLDAGILLGTASAVIGGRGAR